MSIDRGFLGFALQKFTVTISQERLACFAEAIGETKPVLDGDIVTPTFLKVIEGEGGSSRKILDELHVDLKRILHAEQHFEYFLPVRAGDTITVERRVSDIYEKKDGQMEFIVIESSFSDPAGRLAAKSRQVVLLRNPKRESQHGN